MKQHLRYHVQPKGKADLITGIRNFWSSLSKEQCAKHVSHVQKVIPRILYRQGEASGY
jgi:hypothetical protein